jgi:DNA-binding SARP family transcriptional activator
MLSEPGNPVAWRIAELEREVRELRRTNEALRAYVARELKLSNGVSEDARWAPEQPPQSPEQPGPMVELRALGPIEAVVGGRVVDLGAPKQRALLALLVGKVGEPVAVDVIVEELWAGNPPPSAIASLQAYVANLRRMLEPGRAPRTPPKVLRTYGRGYLLDSRGVEVDVDRFSERALAGWQALEQGDPRRAVRAFDAALVLWRGQAYAEVAETTCVRPDVARLEELRLAVVEGRCAALLAAGAREVAVAELEALVQAHPLRESGCELLSLALYRAGRQADALAVLRTNQRRLAEELGIDPRPELQLLEQQILNQAPSLDGQPHLRAAVKPARHSGHRGAAGLAPVRPSRADLAAGSAGRREPSVALAGSGLTGS